MRNSLYEVLILSNYMATPRATLFDPVKGTRVAVDVGSQQSRDLFAKGFKLEGPTQNVQTYNTTAPKQIVQQQGGPQLYAQDSTTGAQTYIKSPSELPGLISQGYQDTRSPINFSGGGVPALTAPSTSGAGAGYGASGSASATPSVNPADSFNASVMALLKQNQSGDLDKGLYADRNSLINQRFNTISASPTGSAEILSPDQARSIRSQEVSGITERLGGVDAALRSRAASRDEYSRQLKDTLGMIKEQKQEARDDWQQRNALRDDARATIRLGWDTYGSEFFSRMSEQERRDYENTAGFPPGTLSIASKTMKEETLDIKKEDAERKGFRFIPATKNQPAGYWDADTQTFHPLAKGSSGGGYGSSSGGSGGGGGGGATGVPKGFDVDAQTQLTNLSTGKSSWGSAFNALKLQYPNVPNATIDTYLNKDKWSVGGAYETFKNKAGDDATAPPWKTP